MKRKELFWLFGVNFIISAFTLGGGYTVIPMIRRYFVTQRGLFSEEELLDMSAISQSTPGAIAINLSALAGYRCAKTIGMIVSCIGALLPPLLILTVISSCYHAFISNTHIRAVLNAMEAGVAAMVVDTVAGLCLRLQKSALFLAAIVFLVTALLKVNVVYVLLASCLVCITGGFWKRRRNKR